MRFYFVDNDYVKYLQSCEMSQRGFSRVPNMEYAIDQKRKFVFGSVLEINNYYYFAPVTSYNKKKSENISIPAISNPNQIISTIRFNYMFPVPKECLTPFNFSDLNDFNYYRLVLHEYSYLKSMANEVRLNALNTYDKIVNKTGSKNLLFNSCDFELLEKACDEYVLLKK